MRTMLTVQTVDAPLMSLDRIAEFAAGCNSHLTIVVVGIAAPLPTMAVTEIPSYDWGVEFDNTLQFAQKRASEYNERFSKSATTVSAIATCQSMAGVAEMLRNNALYADYVVLPDRETLSPSIHDQCLDGAVFQAGIPVLLMPENQTETPHLKSVMAAWHPSAHTARAIRSAADMLDKGTAFHIAIVDPKEYIYGPNPGDDLAAYLARKELDVTVHRLAGNDRSIAQTLNQQAMDLDVDMIVMGAFGHSKMREWLMGSTTTRMLESYSMPVMLCH